MKRSTGREFFEVFRRAPGNEKSRSWWSKKPQAAAAQADAPEKPGKGALKRDTTTPPGRVALTFSHEALVVYIVVLALMLVGAFIWGYSTGREQPVLADNSLTPPRLDVPTEALAVGSNANKTMTLSVTAQPAGEYYTLRLMESPNLQRAQQVAADLKAMGYDAFYTQPVKGTWAVNVGRLADYRGAEAKELKDQISTLQYKNSAWFKACSWHKEGSSKR